MALSKPTDADTQRMMRSSHFTIRRAAEADLLISKSAGNFYTLDEYRPPTDAVCLLMPKCAVHARQFGTRLLDPVLHIQHAPRAVS